MTYGDILKNGTRIPVTDNWIRANKRNVLITAPSSATVGDDVQIALQLRAGPLLDGTYEDSTERRGLRVLVTLDGDTESHPVVLENGTKTFLAAFDEPGIYTVSIDDVSSVAVQIEVT